jgi:Cu2+-exporting ATPase
VLLSNRLDALVQAFPGPAHPSGHHREPAVGRLYNGLMLPFAALGWITPVWAAVGMSVSSLTVVLNALRLTRLPRRAPLVTRPAEPRGKYRCQLST